MDEQKELTVVCGTLTKLWKDCDKRYEQGWALKRKYRDFNGTWIAVYVRP